MTGIAKPLEQLVKDDLDALVRDGVAESRTLEFKTKLVVDTDDDKQEFLNDISSFANAQGGDIIYGANPKKDANGKTTGEAEKIVGLTGFNYDKDVARLENVIRDGISPRIAGIRFKQVDSFDSGPALVVRVPRSWQSPHMIKRSGRFFARNNTGKYPLDIGEIRAAILQSESLTQRLREFRAERLARIKAGETPVRLPDGPKTILHVVPASSLAEFMWLDVRQFRDHATHLNPMLSSGWSTGFNFDGFMVYTRHGSDFCSTYTQAFRNGAIEAVEGLMIGEFDRQKQISIRRLEDEVIEALKRYLVFMDALEIRPPFAVMLSLINVRGYSLALVNQSLRQNSIDRDDLILPDVAVIGFDESVALITRPIFDAVWQSCGIERSLCYDKDGKRQD